MAHSLMEEDLNATVVKIIAKADFLIRMNTPTVFKKDQSGNDSNVIALAKSFSGLKSNSGRSEVISMSRQESGEVP